MIWVSFLGKEFCALKHYSRGVEMSYGKAVKGFLLVMAIISFSICGCDMVSNLFSKPQPPKADDVAVVRGTLIAKVGNIPVTMEELDYYVDASNTYVDNILTVAKQRDPNLDTKAILEELNKAGLKKIETIEDKTEFLEKNLIQGKLLYQEAIDRGLDRKGETKETLEKAKQEFEKMKVDIIVASLLEEEKEKNQASESEIQNFYNENKNIYYHEPEKRRVREIVTKSEADARAALAEVYQPGADFGEVAKKYSIAASKAKGGDLGFIGPQTKGEKFEKFDAAVFYTTEVGGVSNILQNPETKEFFIVKVEEKIEGKDKPFTEVKTEIKDYLDAQKQSTVIKNLVDKLGRDIKVEKYFNKIR